MAEKITAQDSEELSEKIFTLDELSKYNGENDMPSYIAIKGIVYDISNLAILKGGKHHGVTGGKDVTKIFPHDINILKRAKVVGRLE